MNTELETVANNNTDPQPTEMVNEAGQTEPAKVEQADSEQRDGLANIAGQADGASEEGAPDSYDFSSSLPDGAELDEETATSFGEVCKNMNLTNEQANDLAKYGYQYAAMIAEKESEAREREIDSWADDTRKQLGADFTSTMDKYATGLSYMERTFPGVRQVLNETGAGNRIEIVQAFATLGRLVSEDPGVGARGIEGGNSNPYPNTDFSKY